MATSISLFQVCVSRILKSPYLLRISSLHLPQKISHYLLHEACEQLNLVAVQSLIEVWPHRKLSFDFVSNPLCSQKKKVSSICVEPHEYYQNLPTSQYADCILSITVGVFNNVQNCMMLGLQPALQVVDLSRIQVVEKEQVEALCKLLRGEFPGRHTSDYVSTSDLRKVGGKVRPQLPHNPFDYRIKIHLNIAIHSRSGLDGFIAACNASAWFQVVVKGLNVTALAPKIITHALKAIDLSELKDLYLLSSTFAEIKSETLLPATPQHSNLWLCTRFGSPGILLPLLQSVSCLDQLILTSNAVDLETIFDCLAESSCSIRGLTLLICQSAGFHARQNAKFASCVLKHSSNLEYLQLRSWNLTNTHMEVIGLCHQLQVLCVTEGGFSSGSVPVYHVSDVLQPLVYLSKLEYFEWSETINVRTPDLLCLRCLLTDSLPNLHHWHMNLPYMLLSTTDLENEEYVSLKPLLVPLICGKQGDDSCTTYRFRLENDTLRLWLSGLRSEVCFKVGKDVRDSSCSTLHFMY